MNAEGNMPKLADKGHIGKTGLSAKERKRIKSEYKFYGTLLVVLFMISLAGIIIIISVHNKMVNPAKSQNLSAHFHQRTASKVGQIYRLADDSPTTESDTECRDVHEVGKWERCDFVLKTDDCKMDEGKIDYPHFIYCTFTPDFIAVPILVCALWLLLLLLSLSISADDFFCPCLAVVAKTLHLNENLAGVTFLAFGNGAPDIFTAVVAVQSSKEGDLGLAFGALLGACTFVTTIVFSSIMLVKPFYMRQRPFLRDVTFYLAAVFWVFRILWIGQVNFASALGFVILYAVYVFVVVIGKYINSKLRQRRARSSGLMTQAMQDQETADESSTVPKPRSLDLVTEVNEDEEPIVPPHENAEGTLILPKPSPALVGFKATAKFWVSDFWSVVNPVKVQEFRSGAARWWSVCHMLVRAPILLVLRLTVPIMPEKGEKVTWSKPMMVFQLNAGPLFACLGLGGFDIFVGALPFPVIVVLCTLALSILVCFTSDYHTPPRYFPIFSFLAFAMSVIWLYLIVNEIIDLLQTFGVVLNISNAILGLTVLAWGNSIQDLVADTLLAKQGYPMMASSAVFGGTSFNIMLGLGIPFTIFTINHGTYMMAHESLNFVLVGGIGLSLLSTFLVVPLSSFYVSKWYAIYLIALYVTFLIMTLLVETKVIV